MISGFFSAQVLKYGKAKPGQGHLIRAVPFEKWLKRNYCGPACLTMVLDSRNETRSFSQGKIKERFIRTHDLQVWALRIERAWLESN